MVTGTQTFQSRQFLAGKADSHHAGEVILQRALKEAVRKVEVAKHVDGHTFRHSFTILLT
jgi:hypothetical protein